MRELTKSGRRMNAAECSTMIFNPVHGEEKRESLWPVNVVEHILELRPLSVVWVMHVAASPRARGEVESWDRVMAEHGYTRITPFQGIDEEGELEQVHLGSAQRVLMHYEDQDMAEDLGRPSELLFKSEGNGSMREHLEKEVSEDLWVKEKFTKFSKRSEEGEGRSNTTLQAGFIRDVQSLRRSRTTGEVNHRPSVVDNCGALGGRTSQGQ
jgi:hypothetical protein